MRRFRCWKIQRKIRKLQREQGWSSRSERSLWRNMGKKNSKLKQDTIDRLTNDTYCEYRCYFFVAKTDCSRLYHAFYKITRHSSPFNVSFPPRRFSFDVASFAYLHAPSTLPSWQPQPFLATPRHVSTCLTRNATFHRRRKRRFIGSERHSYRVTRAVLGVTNNSLA